MSPHLEYSLHGYPGNPGLAFVNGLGGLKETWVHQVRRFARDFHVLTYNQRGAGASRVADGDCTMRDFAADLLHLMDRAGMASASVVGISFGGRVVQELLLASPQRVDRAVLVACSCGGRHQVLGDSRAVGCLRRAHELGAREWLECVIPAMFGASFRRERAALLPRLAQYWSMRPQDPLGLTCQWRAHDAFDSWDRLPRINVPTLIVHGRDDTLVPPANARILADRIPGARVVLLPHAGHAPNTEVPRAFNRVLGAFLVERPGGS